MTALILAAAPPTTTKIKKNANYHTRGGWMSIVTGYNSFFFLILVSFGTRNRAVNEKNIFIVNITFIFQEAVGGLVFFLFYL